MRKDEIHWSEVLIVDRHGKSVREHCRRLRKSFVEYTKEKNIPYVCFSCKMKPVWNNEPLDLQIDHTNEIRSDNRPENLRWVCPNCHHQMSQKIRKRYTCACPDCGKRMTSGAKKCLDCFQKEKLPDRLVLSKLVLIMPYKQIAKEFGVTPKTIRCWRKKLNIPSPHPWGYWLRKTI